MAAGVVVICPECAKKFKPKADVQGKKIKCPFCAHAFVVPAAKEETSKSAASKRGKPTAADAKAAPDAKPAAAEKPVDHEDENPDPYGVKNVELVPRCPNCTEEMGPHDIVCLACGYNTLTRQWGKTEKTVGLTFSRHLLYLLPAFGAATFAILTIIGMIVFATVFPYYLEHDSWLSFTNHESMRMWSTVINLGWIWAAAVFCFKKFIDKPKPDEITID